MIDREKRGPPFIGMGKWEKILKLGLLATVLAVSLAFITPDALSDHPRWRIKNSGNNLYKQCEQRLSPDGKLVGEMICAGFIIGIADSGAHKACLPDELVISQVTDVVVAWLRNNPALRHHPAAHLVAKALEDAYPCP